MNKGLFLFQNSDFKAYPNWHSTSFLAARLMQIRGVERFICFSTGNILIKARILYGKEFNKLRGNKKAD